MSGRVELGRYLLAMLCLAACAHGDVRHVEVGGQITLYGEWYRDGWPDDARVRWPGAALRGRSIGTAGNDITSYYGFDDAERGYHAITQWNRLHFKAAPTDGVNAFVELDQQFTWGEMTRAGHFTGADFPVEDNVNLYQAYIEVEELGGLPLQLRVGRQEILLGDEFLVGNNDYASVPYFGLSFDALRLTYAEEALTVDAFAARIAQDAAAGNDTHFAGVHGTWQGTEALALSAYWLWLRDGSEVAVEPTTFPTPLLDRMLGLNDYGDTSLHTLGASAGYERGPFTLDAELAWQWGDAPHAGALFRPGWYGDDRAEYDAWALHVDGGYTFEAAWSPWVHVAYTWLDGEDHRDGGFGEWLRWNAWPWREGRASLSFNRLFSDFLLGSFLDASELTGVQAIVVGGSVSPTEAVSIDAELMHLRATDAFHRPVFPVLPFITRANDKELGWESYLGINYAYSEDLSFTVGWAHFFTGKGAEQGHFVAAHGFDFIGGSARDDLDYFYFTSTLKF